MQFDPWTVIPSTYHMCVSFSLKTNPSIEWGCLGFESSVGGHTRASFWHRWSMVVGAVRAELRSSRDEVPRPMTPSDLEPHGLCWNLHRWVWAPKQPCLSNWRWRVDHSCTCLGLPSMEVALFNQVFEADTDYFGIDMNEIPSGNLNFFSELVSSRIAKLLSATLQHCRT